MRHQAYCPQEIELLAKNIILSMGGALYPQEGHLVLRVMGKDGTVEEKSVSSVFFSPGEKHRGCYVGFLRDTYRVTEEEDMRRIWRFIVDNYSYPDRDISLDEESLRRRLELREMNIGFISKHGDINAGDIEMVEAYQKAIADMHDRMGDHPVPVPGDIVEGAYYDGAYPFKDGLLLSNPHGVSPLSVCVRPYVPFVYLCKGDDTISLNASGGPFFGVEPSDLEYIGADRRAFCDWGHAGCCANGTVEFMATVNRWRWKK